MHLDVDTYISYKNCLEFIYPLVINGGIILFDDYGSPTCEGATLACNEFFKDKETIIIDKTAYIKKTNGNN